jgi:hypothetical protein
LKGKVLVCLQVRVAPAKEKLVLWQLLHPVDHKANHIVEVATENSMRIQAGDRGWTAQRRPHGHPEAEQARESFKALNRP